MRWANLFKIYGNKLGEERVSEMRLIGHASMWRIVETLFDLI